ncbi:MAG TPA: diguanylate cyclase [Geminicoccaceae bacterium]|nr:diguanylate cyclase [Geminicoccaceae bacterium]
MTEGGTVAGRRALVDFLPLCPVGIVACRTDGTIEQANPAAARALAPLLADAALDNLIVALAARVPELGLELARSQGPPGTVLEQRMVEIPGPAGGSCHVLWISKLAGDRFLAVLADVTQVMRQERRVRADHERFRAMVDHVRDYAICTLDRDGRIEEWNRSLERVGGWQAGAVEGRPATMFVPPAEGGGNGGATGDERLAALEQLLELARRQGSVESEGWCLRADGGRFWANSVVTARPDGAGEVQGYIAVTRDISLRKQALDELRARAETDALTGLMNRSAFEALAEAALAAQRPGAPPIALLLLDADHFKLINDRHGHEAGDAALCHLAGVLRALLRERDSLARWGGEEFAVLLPETSLEGAIAVAERLRAVIETNPAPLPDGSVALAASIGVAVARERHPLRELLRRADDALYAAKAQGRNRVVAAA